ncbi:MAG TPA: helix-turn-helix domain-containing protein [Gemmatimonadaceae bacterium]
MSAVSMHRLSPALSRFVSGLHYFEADDDSPPELERILPGGNVHLMVNLHEDEFRIYEGADYSEVRRSGGAVLEGAASRARVIDTGLQRNLICVDFSLGGAAAFFNLPVSEAQDSLVDLDQLWGRDGALVRERLLEARTPDSKLLLLHDLLVEHLAARDAPDRAVRSAASLLEQGVSIADAASRVGLLSKTLNRRFQALIGLTPKRFARVRRLQRVLGSLGALHEVDWVETAIAHGFADQAHLIHDFHDLTGLTPTAYRSRSPESQNHVPVHSA